MLRYGSDQLLYRYIQISKIHRYRVRYSSSISKFCRLGYIRCRPAAALPGCCSVLDTDCSVGNSLHINWRASGSCSSARPSLSTGSCGGGRGRSGRRRPGRRRRLRLHSSRRWLRCRWHHLLINSRLTARSALGALIGSARLIKPSPTPSPQPEVPAGHCAVSNVRGKQ